MIFLERRLQKAEESLGNPDSSIEDYKAALKKWFAGEIEYAPEPPSSLGFQGNLNKAEVAVLALHELEKAARLEGREFEPRFGSKGMTVKDSLDLKGIEI